MVRIFFASGYLVPKDTKLEVTSLIHHRHDVEAQLEAALKDAENASSAVVGFKLVSVACQYEIETARAEHEVPVQVRVRHLITVEADAINTDETVGAIQCEMSDPDHLTDLYFIAHEEDLGSGMVQAYGLTENEEI